MRKSLTKTSLAMAAAVGALALYGPAFAEGAQAAPADPAHAAKPSFMDRALALTAAAKTGLAEIRQLKASLKATASGPASSPTAP